MTRHNAGAVKAHTHRSPFVSGDPPVPERHPDDYGYRALRCEMIRLAYQEAVGEGFVGKEALRMRTRVEARRWLDSPEAEWWTRGLDGIDLGEIRAKARRVVGAEWEADEKILADQLERRRRARVASRSKSTGRENRAEIERLNTIRSAVSLEQLRRARGLKKIDIATQLGISARTVLAVERGQPVTLRTLRGVLQVLGVNTERAA